MWPHPDYDDDGLPIYEYRDDDTIDMKGFKDAWFHRYIAKKLEEAESRKLKRILISVPVRHGKTLLVNKFIEWYMGRNPDHSIIHASANEANAQTFGKEIRNDIDTINYKSIFPDITLATDSAATSKFDIVYPGTENGKLRGSYLAIGFGSSTQGKKGNLIVLDDVIGKAELTDSANFRQKMWDWYLGNIYTRKEPNAVIIVVQTRYHEDDIIGRLKKYHAHEEWFEINIPIQNTKGDWLWLDRFSKKEYEDMRQGQSSRNWNAMYMQRPVQDEGEIFKRSEFKMYPGDQALPEFEFILQSYDTAYGEGQDGDYNAAITFGIFNAHKWCPEKEGVDEKYTTRNQYGIMIIDAWHERIQFPEMRQIMADEYDSTFGGRKTDLVIVEGKATGLSLIQELRLTGIPVKSIIPKGDKRSRAYSIQHILEGGHVWLPESKRKKGEFRDWVEPFLKELVAFDKGEHDDFVDAFVQGIRYLSDTGWMRAERLVEEEDISKYLRKKRESAYG